MNTTTAVPRKGRQSLPGFEQEDSETQQLVSTWNKGRKGAGIGLRFIKPKIDTGPPGLCGSAGFTSRTARARAGELAECRFAARGCRIGERLGLISKQWGGGVNVGAEAGLSSFHPWRFHDVFVLLYN